MQRLGLFVIVVSFLPWVAIVLVVPFLPLTVAQKALLVPILAVVAEVAFWLGLLLVGKEVATRYRGYFTPRRIWNSFRKLLRKR